MKKTAIPALLALPLLFTSCLFDEEDVFDKSASERIEAAKNEAKTVLESAQNGWHVRYFPSPTQEFGGYNLFFKFSDDLVTIASETEDDTSATETSLYSLGEDLGVTLNFDTKNSIINYFVHPKNPDGLGSSYKGMEGDYKFTVMEATPERVVLRGIISGSRYVLTPVPVGTEWASELETYRNNSDDMAFDSYTFVVNGTSYPTTIANRRFEVKIDNSTTLSVPFIYTKTGISFYEPVEIGGVTAQDFDFVDEYYFTEANGADFKIMTPEPVRSDITFTMTVPVETRTYNKVVVQTEPSNDTEYYYVGAMLKSEFESQLKTLREKKFLQELVRTLNSNIGAEDDPETIAANLLHKGASSYTMDYPSFYDEYVAFAFGCAVSEGAIVSTTSITSLPFSVDSSLLPSNTAENYKRWLGKWAVTSASSETSGTPYTFYITVKPDVINSNFKISGWGYTTYANRINITATYRSGNLCLSQQDNLYQTATGAIGLYNRYVDRDNAAKFGIVASSNAENLKATYGEKGKASMAGRSGSLASGVKFLITCLEMYERRAGSNSYYYLPIASGYTSLDYFVGPYTMVQLVDADGNEVAGAQSAAAAPASVAAPVAEAAESECAAD